MLARDVYDVEVLATRVPPLRFLGAVIASVFTQSEVPSKGARRAVVTRRASGEVLVTVTEPRATEAHRSDTDVDRIVAALELPVAEFDRIWLGGESGPDAAAEAQD